MIFLLQMLFFSANLYFLNILIMSKYLTNGDKAWKFLYWVFTDGPRAEKYGIYLGEVFSIFQDVVNALTGNEFRSDARNRNSAQEITSYIHYSTKFNSITHHIAPHTNILNHFYPSNSGLKCAVKTSPSTNTRYKCIYPTKWFSSKIRRVKKWCVFLE